MSTVDLSALSMVELFQLETESQTEVLTAGLLALERNPSAPAELESCMRAAHSLKGAARLVDRSAGVAVAHAMEDCFVAAQEGRISLGRGEIDLLLQGVDLLIGLAKTPDAEIGGPDRKPQPNIVAYTRKLEQMLATQGSAEPPALPETSEPVAAPAAEPEPAKALTTSDAADRMLRVTADNVNRLLGLAGESLVESRWLKPFGESLLRLKRLHNQCGDALRTLSDALPKEVTGDRARMAMRDAQSQLLACQGILQQQLAALDLSDRRTANLAQRLYDSALACRMRPFSDGVHAFPRMVRDLGHSLGKQVRLEIVGGATKVDRDILEKLDAPLGHLLRNAIDHGIETPEERLLVGKPADGVIKIEARHGGGALHITISDDGRGVDVEALRKAVVERGIANKEMSSTLSESELLEFLFLPGFSMKGKVTEVSGRGVGLDVVQDMIKQARGIVRIASQLGAGTRFQLQLPLTLSVVRALVTEVGGDLYAIPLAYILRVVKVRAEQIEMLEGRQHFLFEGRNIGLVAASQILGSGEHKIAPEDMPVIIVSDHSSTFGLAVARFLGRHELVVQAIDARLGKVQDVSAAALMADGAPVLIVDVEDMIRSMERLAFANRLSKVREESAGAEVQKRKRVLVVDDSLTVRELERKLLARHGYDVDVAVDGMDGWNAARSGDFDLVVTDIDMPRMDGIALVALIRKGQTLRSTPVIIVSYKDREEDRQRGLEAGADFYLTKGSFHDDRLVQTVVDLIGEAAA